MCSCYKSRRSRLPQRKGQAIKNEVDDMPERTKSIAKTLSDSINGSSNLKYLLYNTSAHHIMPGVLTRQVGFEMSKNATR